MRNEKMDKRSRGGAEQTGSPSRQESPTGLYFAVKILLLDRHGFMEDSSFQNPMLDDMEVTVRPL